MRQIYRTYLWSEEESQVTTAQGILDPQGHLLGEAQVDLVRQAGSFAEVDEVFEREGKSHGFRQLYRDILFGFLDICVLADSHRAAANIALA
jgi:hypothetical protein